MTTDDRQEEHDSDAQEASERRASTSIESPTNVTRSTQDLTIGGSEKHAESQAGASAPDDELLHASPADEKTSPVSPEPTAERREKSADGLSNAKQAVEKQERALESGEEAPG
jgi:hypothetical protein